MSKGKYYLAAAICLLAIVATLTYFRWPSATEEMAPLKQTTTESTRAITPPARESAGRTESKIDAAVSNIPSIRASELTKAKISGTVTDQEGNPLENATVTLIAQNQSRLHSEATDTDGGFSISGPDLRGDFKISATKEGFALIPIEPVVVPTEGLHGLRLKMVAAASISGIVVDASGAPVAGALVFARPSGNMVSTLGGVLTNERAEFTINGLYEGSYFLDARLGQGAIVMNTDSELFSVVAGQQLAGVRVLLQGGTLSISGRVTNTEGEPIANAAVTMTSGPHGGETRTLLEGTYICSGLTEGIYRVTVTADGYARQALDDILAGSTDVDFELAPADTVAGRVIDGETKKPVGEFSIAIVRGANASLKSLLNRRVPMKSFVDELGRFNADRIDNGPASIFVVAPGYAPSVTKLADSVSGEAEPEIEIALDRGARIVGRVVDASGAPIADAEVVQGGIQLDELLKTSTKPVLTDAEGKFLMEDVQIGTITLSATRLGYSGGTVQVETEAGESATTEIVLGAAGGIRVIARSGTSNIVGANVSLSAHIQTGGNTFGQTDANGIVEFNGLPEGIYSVGCGLSDSPAGGTGRRMTQDISLGNGEKAEVIFDFAVGGAALQGTVSYNNEPLPEARVDLTVGTADASAEDRRKATSDASGAFVFENLLPGEALLGVRGTVGGEPLERSYVVQLRDNETSTLHVDLSGGGRITGGFSGLDGEGVVNAMLFSGDVEVPRAPTPSEFEAFIGPLTLVKEGVVNSDAGTVHFRGLNPGVYTVVLYAYNQEDIDANAPGFTIRTGSAKAEIESEDDLVEIAIVFP